MTVIVVPVNGVLSYVGLPLSRPQQLAKARRINLPRFSQLTHSLSFPLPPLSAPSPRFLPFITVSRFMPLRRPASKTPPKKKRLTKAEHEPFILLCNKKKKKKEKGRRKGDEGRGEVSLRLRRAIGARQGSTGRRGREISPEFHFVPPKEIVLPAM